jgi:hypothetical protein
MVYCNNTLSNIQSFSTALLPVIDWFNQSKHMPGKHTFLVCQPRLLNRADVKHTCPAAVLICSTATGHGSTKVTTRAALPANTCLSAQLCDALCTGRHLSLHQAGSSNHNNSCKPTRTNAHNSRYASHAPNLRCEGSLCGYAHCISPSALSREYAPHMHLAAINKALITAAQLCICHHSRELLPTSDAHDTSNMSVQQLHLSRLQSAHSSLTTAPAAPRPPQKRTIPMPICQKRTRNTLRAMYF